MLPSLATKSSKSAFKKKETPLVGQTAEAQAFLNAKPEKYGNKDADVVIR